MAANDGAIWTLFGQTANSPVSLLPGLVPDGQHFRQADGSTFTAIECTDFELLHWYLDGRDIRPVLAQRQAFGFTMVRVWTCYDFDGPLGHWVLLPAQRPEVYARLGDFLALCGSYGLYVELVAYTNIPDLAHWEKLGQALDGAKNVLVEWRNEHAVVNGGQYVDNGVLKPAYMDSSAFHPLPGIVCSHGSADLDGSPAVKPYWDYATAHFNGQFEWWRKTGHNSMEIWGGPTLANENTRYPDDEQSLTHAYDAMAGAALLCAGACYHSVSGKKSEPWQSGVEQEAARQWAAGGRSVDLACQRGPYVRRDDLLRPGLLRVYERPTGSHSCIVSIRA